MFVPIGSVRADQPDGIRIDFPTSDSLPYDKFGVFIGIDHYSKLPAANQLNGCIADATGMKETFVRLGVERYAMLTDGQATRAGIGRVLSELVDQVKFAKTKTKEPITVVITYAGHGCRVKRLPQEHASADDQIDSSWVAADSDIPGTNDVRGYELQQIHRELAKLGAQVLLISDSCHSGSAYRGLDDTRVRSIDSIARDPNARDSTSAYLRRLGPKDDLFPQFASAESASGLNGSANAGEPLPGFVFFSACGDQECDYEARDEHGNSCGPLSLVMRHVLSNLGEDTTYQEVANKIATEFAVLPGNAARQSPEFHAAYGKADELFFKGGYPPAHANIAHNSIHNDMLKLSMGSVLGVAPGAAFTFYKDLDDLSAHRNPIATGQATAVQAFACDVQLDENATVPESACAAMNTVTLTDFVLATEGQIPDYIQAKLHELADKHQIQLDDTTGTCTAVLRYDSVHQTVKLYSPTALPPIDDRGSDDTVPTLRPPIQCRSADDLERVATNILYAARIQRMMTLEHEDSGLLKTEVLPQDAPARSVNGIPRFSEGSFFNIRVTNTSTDTPVYVTLLTLDKNGDLQILYPERGNDDDNRPLDPGSNREIPFQATIDDPAHLKAGDAEISLLKVMAMDQQLDLSSLAVPPQTGAANIAGTRGVGESSPVFDLMKDVLHGGDLDSQLTRGVPRRVISEKWATSNLIFGVDRPQPK